MTYPPPDPNEPASWPEATVARFWSWVDKRGATECWPWRGVTSRGYGRFHVRHQGTRHQGVAHRFAYRLIRGPISDSLQLDHLCRNRACCNPDHLEPVTGRVNTLRGESFAAENAAKERCPRGHEYAPRRTKYGWRWCRECRRVAAAKDGARKVVRANERARYHRMARAAMLYFE